MTLEENKAVVRSWIERWNTVGVNAVDDLFASSFTDQQLAQRLGQPVTLEGLKASLRALEGMLGHGEFEEQEMIAEGDRVMVRWILKGTHIGPFLGLPATNRPFHVDGVNIFRVLEGRIVERWSFLDVPSLLLQLEATVTPIDEGADAPRP